MPVDSADTLWVKIFVEIALSRSVSEINAFLRLTQKIKMAAKKKVASTLCGYPVGQIFIKIALSRSVSEINAFLRLTQKIKMAAKNGGKMIFTKSCQ